MAARPPTALLDLATFNVENSSPADPATKSDALAQIAPEDGQDGGQPGGNIRVAVLYNPTRGTLVDRPGATANAANTVQVIAGKPQLEFSPGRINPTSSAFEHSRKPLAAQFTMRLSGL